MLYLLHGPGVASSRNVLVRLKGKYNDSEVVVVEKGIISLGKLQEISESSPMFSNKRLIVLEEALSYLRDEIFEYLEELPSFVDIIFWQPEELKRSNKLYQFIFKQKGVIYFFREEAPREVFPFLDALIGRNKKVALLELNGLLLAGKEPLYILKMIAWQIRNLLRVKDNPSSEKRLHPLVFKKITANIHNFNYEEVVAAHKNILNADLLIKSKNVDPSFVLFRLVLDIVR